LAAFCLMLLCALVVVAPSVADACVPPSAERAASTESADADEGSETRAEESADAHETSADDKEHAAHEACCPGELESGQCAADCDYCGCCGHMMGSVGWGFSLHRHPAPVEEVSVTFRDAEGHSMRLFKPPRALL